MIQYYEDPQGIKIKTNMVKWEKVNPEFLIAALKSNSLNNNHYLNNIAQNSIMIYNQQNNTNLPKDENLLFKIGKVHEIKEDECYVEISFYLPVKGYNGIVFDEAWTILWVEKVAYNLAKTISFDSWMKGFESRYPADLFENMKKTWENYL
jgi:hypothetical protein